MKRGLTALVALILFSLVGCGGGGGDGESEDVTPQETQDDIVVPSSDLVTDGSVNGSDIKFA
jgi:hypothetical protein